MSKGSKRRPQRVSDSELESNWAKAFKPRTPEIEGMWSHHCPAQGVPISTRKGSGCNWCDAEEYK